VILGPGDVLYIPPFTFHQVSVVTPPGRNETENAVSISVSVHTNSKEADLRTKMIDKSLKLPIRATASLEERICDCHFHLLGLFADRKEAFSFVKQLLGASYAHFEEDDANAVGLLKQVKLARKTFPQVKDCAKYTGNAVFYAEEGRAIRQIVQQATNLDIAGIMLNDYLQDVVDLFMLRTPTQVDPFLRWFVNIIKEGKSVK
jgi:hypothetical protein